MRDGRDWLWANLDLALVCTAMLSKSLIQIFADAWDCAPMLIQEMQEMGVRSLGQEDPLEEGLATHVSFLAWRVPRTEEPGRLQSMGPQRVRYD